MVDKCGFKKLLQLYILLINIFIQTDEKKCTQNKAGNGQFNNKKG